MIEECKKAIFSTMLLEKGGKGKNSIKGLNVASVQCAKNVFAMAISKHVER